MIIADIKLGRKNPEVISEKTSEQIRDEFKALVEQYKIDNPVKYAIKKEALDAQLAVLEAAIPSVSLKVKKSKVK